jgi:hypothetical protein
LTEFSCPPEKTLVLAGEESEVREALLWNRYVVWIGGPPTAPSEHVHTVPALSSLLPHLVGLPAYESSDEGLAQWHGKEQN